MAADEQVTVPDDRPVYSVSEINQRVRSLLEAQPDLQDVWLEGELSNWTGPHPSSGHAYFRMKDDDAEIDCVMWRRSVRALDIEPEEGMAVLAHGSVGLYETRGSYQFYIDRMLEAGRGELYLRFQMLKKELAEEGLFDEAVKQPVPSFPRTIGVVTSRSAAAFQDLLNVLRRRSPHVNVLLADARVQGEGAAETIARGIERLNARARAGDPVDVIVVTRGGGSLEDLWAFNEEVAVRAVADSQLPVIAGVGHETDWTLIDYAADERAPTPSAAAEVAAPSREETLDRIAEREASMAKRLEHLLRVKKDRLDALASRPVLSKPEALFAQAWQLTDDLAERLPRAMRTRLDAAQARLDALAERSVLRRPEGLVREGRQRLAELETRLPRAADRVLERAENRLSQNAGRLDALSPLKVLARGYAVATRDGETVTSIEDIEAGDAMDVRVTDGSIRTDVVDTEEASP